jgi:hypothetical protein
MRKLSIFFLFLALVGSAFALSFSFRSYGLSAKGIEAKVIKTTGTNPKIEDPGIIKITRSNSPWVHPGEEYKVIDTNDVTPKLVPGQHFLAEVEKHSATGEGGKIQYYLTLTPTRLEETGQKFKSDDTLEAQFPAIPKK